MWKEDKRQNEYGPVDSNQEKKPKGNAGRKSVGLESVPAALMKAPVKSCTTFRAVAAAVELENSTLVGEQQYIGQRASSLNLKPLLTAAVEDRKCCLV